ncbi:D-alanine--D-alanine ligase [Halalkalibacterium halodurans]|uniref:D-alanine--D-alanine ligase n=1 Tax=Halalkalibacterium halodurans TaxID=86665 RepID=A0A0M0KLV2_ALKHA|nr:D-alanine--D-alanine ligase [Halalkalibacterium halodurans]MED3646741.1 D-alanine--D-alanine ligase [Halalkalibacterium halodurans]MED4161262.1 D-alanine--D-alanine ligase [Halalkalibacterium halodurans]TES56375.1 D-alanine--D-alanine ligase [Halalkalibacterium halodurans]TPE70547.1 D-alanine--D-alanine ligase [Halalkalibacterium halodurans]
MKIAVLYGGTSAEREVSLSSGKGIMEALKVNGHEVIGIDFHPDQVRDLVDLDVDLVFIGLHGRLGEDGKVQALLDLLNIPYVGTGVQGSALAMDKAKAKLFFEKAGIRVAEEVVLHSFTYDANAFNFTGTYPVVVKPNQEGSTIGLTVAETEEELLQGIEEAFRHDDTILIEEFIAGTEVTVAVLGNKGEERSLPVVEIVPKNKLYDYESKYAPGMSEHIVPARISEEHTAYVQQAAVRAHQALGCDVYSRVDFIVPNDGSDPVILEVNTLPGMTPTSLYPDAAKGVGMSYEEMIQTFVNLSLKK